MNTTTVDLFAWWAISISGGSIFLALVSIYLYISTKPKRKTEQITTVKKTNPVKDFIFVWVLLGLLVFYIVSVQIGSSLIFAIGNVLVESLLIVYLLRNRSRKSKQR